MQAYISVSITGAKHVTVSFYLIISSFEKIVILSFKSWLNVHWAHFIQ